MTEHFHARRVEMDGYKFDSLSECRRYQELKLLQLAGTITLLEVHPKLYLLPAYNDRKRMEFTADFSYIENGHQVVEDVKPHKNKAGKRVPYLTREFILKWKVLQYFHTTVDFRIVEA